MLAPHTFPHNIPSGFRSRFRSASHRHQLRTAKACRQVITQGEEGAQTQSELCAGALHIEHIVSG